jgi:Ser/Thr protein kinase RdoA (MazF antagonist)
MHLARKALEAYAVPVARITSLKHVYNTTFRITAQSGEQYVLRICHPRRTAVDVVQSELLWLAALRREAGLHVPEPVRNQEAQYVTVMTDPAVPRPCLCALFHWTPGRFLSRTLTPAHLLQVGELTARLHHHAMQWERPAGFTRRRVDNLNPLHQERDDGFDETIAAQAIQAVAAVSMPQAGAVIATVIKKAWDVLQALGEEPDNFGLIHADLHQRNYLFHNGQAGVIDFDDCGYGHWLYDLAVTLYCLTNHPKFAAIKEAFLTGYRRSRPLSKEQEAQLGTFMALRTLQDLLWMIEERDRPAFRDRWHAQMLVCLQALREFILQ